MDECACVNEAADQCPYCTEEVCENCKQQHEDSSQEICRVNTN